MRPDSLCREYKVEVRYTGGIPEVKVLDPPLQRHAGSSRIPHMYKQQRLCLYHPNYGDWTPSKLLADTIVPWISEWLYYYEIWLVTGHWGGGGEHPELGQPV